MRTFATAALVGALLGTAAQADELEALSARIKPSVVHLRMQNASGGDEGSATGFVISEDGLVATNHHVVAHAERLTAKFSDGREVGILGLVADSEDDDLAIVRAEQGKYPPLELGEATKLVEGTPVAVLGSPAGLEFTLSRGIVSAMRPNGLPERLAKGWGAKSSLIQTTAEIAPGSSGSPVVTMDGRVVVSRRAGWSAPAT